MTDMRERILEAAEEQFLIYGYDSTRLDEIVSNAHVSKTAIYKIFGGKRELFIALAEDLTEQLLEKTLKNQDFSITSNQQLKVILENIGHDYLECILQPKNLAKFRLFLSMATKIEEVSKQFYQSAHIKLCAYLKKYLDEATKSGIVEIDDTHCAACFLLALLRSEIHQKALFDINYQPTTADIEEAIVHSVSLFLRGYANKTDT